jgi:hypothetical protein
MMERKIFNNQRSMLNFQGEKESPQRFKGTKEHEEEKREPQNR